jgi:DNA-binding response OmpR family regulator
LSAEEERRLTIFLVEEDDETRRPLVKNLKGYGYRVIVALDEEDALDRVGEGYIHADLVLVNLVGKSPQEALGVGRRIRDQAKYDGQTPLVVMAEEFGASLEGTDVQVEAHDWITYPEDSFQLKNLLARLTAKEAA